GGVARQPRRVSCQVGECDISAAPRWYRHPAGEVLADGGIEGDFATLRHVGQEQRCEYFRDGADLEDGLRRDLGPIGPCTSVRSERSPTSREQPHDRAGPLLGLVDTFCE